MTQIAKPGPSPSPSSQAFWNGAREHRLLVQECGACGRASFYPRMRCPHCWQAALNWRQASGRGSVASYTVVHKPGHPAFAEEAPFVVALIDLEEGVRMLSNVVGCPPSDVKVGMSVSVVWEAQGDHVLPKFTPSEPA